MIERSTTWKNIIGKLIVTIYAVGLVLLHFIRIFDENFWGDEAFSVRLSKMDLCSMINATAEDVHPPLYYIILKFFCGIFGYEGEIYHLVSFVPFLIMVILVLTVIWKWFGIEASVIMLTMIALLEQPITYIVEVRMYSWGALFIFVSFLALYKILTENSKKSYIFFSVFTLLAAYTHYFCLVSVAFFYVFLIIWAIYKRKEYLKRTIIVCIAAVVIYLPWFFVLLKSFARTISDFWVVYIPYVKDCIAYIFSGEIAFLMFFLLCLFVVLSIWYQRADISKVVWIISGLGAVIGTIIVGILVSRLFRPVFLVRYLYPVAVVAWLLLAVGVSYCKRKRIYACILLTVLLVTGIPSYVEIYETDKASNEKLLKTLEITESINQEDSVILTDLRHINWTIAECYYPKAECELIGDMSVLPELENDKQYWILVSHELSKDAKNQLISRGYKSDLLEKDGCIGTFSIVVYKLERLD